VRRARIVAPLVLSVHGPDVLYIPEHYGADKVRPTLQAAALTLANSTAIEAMARDLGAARTRTVHLGADLPDKLAARAEQPTIASLGHLIGRKRHADVLRAMWLLRDRRPDLRYLIIGDGPERAALETLARELRLRDRVTFAGQLAHQDALGALQRAHVMALPSTQEAFGVAYVEAMAAGIPAIGSLGEPGPQEIAHLGGGIMLVAPGDPHDLSLALDRLLDDPQAGLQARATVERHFTWTRCGRETVRAYEDVLR
jgi:glycosyltransferase involved in cell wall biosynthesis